MRIKITSKDIDAVIRGIKISVTEMGKTHEQIAKTAAGQFAVELAGATNPPFFADKFRESMEWKVAANVDDAFPVPWTIYNFLKCEFDVKTAQQWYAIQVNDPVAANRFLATKGKSIAIIQANNVEHRKARTGKQASVPGYRDGFQVLTKRERDEFRDRKVGNVGLAKAGWLAASKSATGKVGSVGGKTVGWVRKLVKKANGFGSFKADQKGFRIELTNAQPYASEAMNARVVKEAEARTMLRLGDYLKKMAREVAKKAKLTESKA